MPIFNSRGEVLNDNDVDMLEQMLRGSLENHIARTKKRQDDAELEGGDPDYYNSTIDAFEKGISDLSKDIKKAKNGKQSINVDAFIDQTFEKITSKIARKINPKNDEAADYGNSLAVQWGNVTLLRTVYEDPKIDSDYRDTPQAYQNTVEDFKFADEAFEGIDEIETVDIENGSFHALEEGRAGSSNTLAANLDELRAAVENAPENTEERRKAQETLEATEKAKMGHHMACEMSRMFANDLKNKEQVSFGDVYSAFASLNEAARPGDKDAGKLRGKYVEAGKIIGVGSVHVPGQLYKTMDIIAHGINQIKKESGNPALQKTHAIQLASFANQMLTSQHVFNDANGRTCRMLADTILQTFGLPPYTPPKKVDPQSEPENSFGMIGDKLAFDWGANYILDGVKRSNAVLQETSEIILPLYKTLSPPNVFLEKICRKIYLITDKWRSAPST